MMSVREVVTFTELAFNISCHEIAARIVYKQLKSVIFQESLTVP